MAKSRSCCVVPSGLISEFKDLLTNKETLIRFDLLDDAELFSEVFSLRTTKGFVLEVVLALLLVELLYEPPRLFLSSLGALAQVAYPAFTLTINDGPQGVAR